MVAGESTSADRTRAWAVIPAGGTGERVGGRTRKQFRSIGGRPVLAHTLAVFQTSPRIEGVILVVPVDSLAVARHLVSRFAFDKVRSVVAGGETRQASVGQGLRAFPPDSRYVMVHDGVRPFLTEELVETVLEAAVKDGAAVAGLPVRETIKRASGGWIQGTVDREGLWSIQTPQAFRADLLRTAHERARREGFVGTDDAVLVERLGHPVRLVPGLPENLKLTSPADFTLAAAILRARARAAKARPSG
jgi:2-C-methyl-D-erythritol 4-phosphate cytidylyltransferase